MRKHYWPKDGLAAGLAFRGEKGGHGGVDVEVAQGYIAEGGDCGGDGADHCYSPAIP